MCLVLFWSKVAEIQNIFEITRKVLKHRVNTAYTYNKHST